MSGGWGGSAGAGGVAGVGSCGRRGGSGLGAGVAGRTAGAGVALGFRSSGAGGIAGGGGGGWIFAGGAGSLVRGGSAGGIGCFRGTLGVGRLYFWPAEFAEPVEADAPDLPSPWLGVLPVGGVALAEGSAAADFLVELVATGAVLLASPAVSPELFFDLDLLFLGWYWTLPALPSCCPRVAAIRRH